MPRFVAHCLAAFVLAQASPSRAAEPAAPKPAARKLTWAPPALESPKTVEITGRIHNHSLKLDHAKDYILRLPAEPLKGGVSIYGGRNVVLIGGEISVPSPEEEPGFKGQARGLYLRDQAGTIHIEGVLISGKGLKEGINLSQTKGATVVLQNLRVEKVQGTRATNHADVIQTWAGPAELRVDGLTGHTSYQGFFLMPNQQWRDGAPPRLFDLRRVNLIGDATSAYLLWHQSRHDGFADHPIKVQDVWVSPNPKHRDDRDRFLWPKKHTGDKAWEAVQVGTPPGGDFVPQGVAGTNYVSPGYEGQ